MRTVAPTVGFGTSRRRSPQIKRCTTISALSRPREAQTRIGMPISSAYQRDDPSEACATELETMPCRPSDRAALAGDSEETSAATPMPPTRTSANGSSHTKIR